MKIELSHICKTFGSMPANIDISIRFESGSIHGILGENGAGKSTLMKILSGYISKSSGDILIDNRIVHLQDPSQALCLGIGMLYQDTLDFPSFSVLDNYVLGLNQSFFSKKKYFRNKLLEWSKRLGFGLSPNAYVNELSIGERQQLELIRLLSLGVQVLILDEPTTGISATQKDILFSALQQLSENGKTVLLISHKLKEIESLCSYVTILRKGRAVIQLQRPFSQKQLLESMFDEPPRSPIPSVPKAGDPVLDMFHVSTSMGRNGLRDCTINTRRGEIIGLAGLEGSGQEVFLRVAAGLAKAENGLIELRGRRLHHFGYHYLKRAGVTFLPSARLEEGLVTGLTITEHMALIQSQKQFINPCREALIETQSRIKSFNIRGYPDTTVEMLSGGNQQRLLLSFIPSTSVLLLLENPTRGLDMVSSVDTWNFLRDAYQSRACIIFSSPDLDELLSNSNRILVFFEGRIINDFPTHQTDVLQLGHAIAGIA